MSDQDSVYDEPRDELLGVKIEDIDRCLKEFYDGITHNRNQHFKQDIGKEQIELRNPMVKYLLTQLEDESVVIDWFSGDAVVPTAILFLQKEFPQKIKKIGMLYTVDLSEDVYQLIEKNAKMFGLPLEKIYRIKDECLNAAKRIAEKPENYRIKDLNISTFIDAAGYMVKTNYKELLQSISSFSPRIEMIQATNSYSILGYAPFLNSLGYETRDCTLRRDVINNGILIGDIIALSAVKNSPAQKRH